MKTGAWDWDFRVDQIFPKFFCTKIWKSMQNHIFCAWTEFIKYDFLKSNFWKFKISGKLLFEFLTFGKFDPPYWNLFGGGYIGAVMMLFCFSSNDDVDLSLIPVYKQNVK